MYRFANLFPMSCFQQISHIPILRMQYGWLPKNTGVHSGQKSGVSDPPWSQTQPYAHLSAMQSENSAVTLSLINVGQSTFQPDQWMRSVQPGGMGNGRDTLKQMWAHIFELECGTPYKGTQHRPKMVFMSWNLPPKLMSWIIFFHELDYI